MEFTVIVPVFQEINILKMFVDSLLNTVNKSTEIIFINDGSGEEVQKCLTSLEKTDMDDILVKVIEHQSPKGCAYSINEALRVSTGKYIFFNDSDTILQKNWQNQMKEVLDSDNNIGVVGGVLLYPQTGGIQHCGIGFSSDIGRHIFLNAPLQYALKETYSVQAVIFALCAIKREVFEKVGFMDEGFFNGYEDFDYQMRIKSLGYNIVVNSEVVAYHWENSNGIHRSFNRKNNLARLWKKWGHMLKDDLWDIIQSKINEFQNKPQINNCNKLIGVDLAEVRNDAEMFWKMIDKTMSIDLIGVLDYSSKVTSEGTVWLPKIMGHKAVERKDNYLFFVDNFVRLMDNKLWFDKRSEVTNKDIIIDLYGNVMYFSDLYNSFWPGSKIR